MSAGAELDTGTPELLARLEDRVAVVTLNRPEARNALSDTLSPALRALIARLAEGEEVGCVPLPGAGLSIALACDLRIAAESASVTTGFARIGLSGDYGASFFLTQLVGSARARELCFTSERTRRATASASAS